MLILVLVALTLIVFDTLTPWFKPAHDWFEQAAQPFYWLTNLPARLADWGDGSLARRSELEKERNRLATELLVYKGQLQRFAELSAENLRLRSLLNATELLSDKVLVTEIIGVSPDPVSHEVAIDRGTADGVFVGQPVIDSDGLMGQVLKVFDTHSRILLLTDYRHAVPVKVARNDLRVIAEGIGDYHQLKLRHVSPTLDIEIGDALVSSGLGGRFPEGYPVGTIREINRNSGQDFLDVTVEPTAKVDRSRHLLLVFSGQPPVNPELAKSNE